jgi:hypothetical protein
MPKSKLHRDQTKTNAVSEPPCEPNPVERWGIHSEEKKNKTATSSYVAGERRRAHLLAYFISHCRTASRFVSSLAEIP